MNSQIHAVTGAFGYSGRYIARRLLNAGHSVITLTNSVDRPDLFASQVRAYPLDFERPEVLTASLSGVSVLYNTYWVRFNHRDFSFARAVANTRTLFSAAKAAGVRRVVHVSITNPSEDSDLEYFRGKAELEHALRESGLSYAILRPTVLFGKEDILINNIAWMLRRFPVFGVFGDGAYRLQPLYVDDLARLAVDQGSASESATFEAIGPETFSYRELVGRIGQIIGKPRPIVSLPPTVGYSVGAALGKLVRDVIVTRDEIEGLMRELLYVEAPAAGTTRLSDWATRHAASLGRSYASELARRTGKR